MKYEAMNAKPCKDLQKLIESKEYIAEIKLDGYRAICEYGRFYSRLGNELTDKVPHLQLPVNMVLDGELLFGNNSSDVTTVLGSKTDRALKLQEKEKVCFVIFDILELDGKNLTCLSWRQRREVINALCRDMIFCVPDVQISATWSAIDFVIDFVDKNNLEGIMLKNINAEYYPGKRPENTWYWYEFLEDGTMI